MTFAESGDVAESSGATRYELSRQQQVCVAANDKDEPVELRVPLPADLDDDAVRAALTAAAAEHEALRTTVGRPAGLRVAVQTVHAELPPVWVESADAASVRAAIDAEHGPVLAAGVSSPGGDRALLLAAAVTSADVPTLELLAAAAFGAANPVADPIQYPEYAAWQQELLAADGDDAATASQAWDRLAGDAAPTTLRCPDAGAIGAAETVPVDTAQPTDTWLAAWVVTLARLGASDQVCVGVQLDPRTDPELAGAAGRYTAFVPLTVEVPKSGSFGDFATAIGAARAQAERWVEWAPAAPAGGALFRMAPAGSSDLRPDFQLELAVTPEGDAGRVSAGPSGSARLARLAARSLANVLGASSGSLADAELLDADEVRAELGAAPEPVGTAPVLAQILAAAERCPDRPALTDGARTLTYADLVRRVDGLAAALLDAGASAAAPVALHLPPGLDLIVALLAAQRAGAGYVPLDIDQPAARLQQQLDTCGGQVLVGEQAPAGFAGTVVPPSAAGSAALPEPALDQLAYVIFTSGSTGTPKGVAVGAASLANYVAAAMSVIGPPADPDAVRAWGLVTTPVTDLGNTAIYPALASGGTLHVLPRETVQDPVAFGAYVDAHPIDVLKITPSHLAALLSDPTVTVLPREVLVSGGEALPWQLVDEVRRRGTCRIVNHYGPTETTVGALAFPVGDAASGPDRSVPIGYPLSGNEAFVVDAYGRLVPRGGVGELAISGAGLARGYWGDDDLTATRFVPHPYRPDARVYLTGDLVWQSDDGAITFLGRRDGQVKLRGFRIERGEVEAALLAHPSVRRAAAVIRTDAEAPQLVGYVVCQVNPAPTERELQAHLADRLPSYMIPARIVTLDVLPLRPNGKLDEAALPEPPAQTGRTHVPPDGELEQRVADIFSAVLGVPEVGALDDFFELGGHSLLATRIIVEIRSAFGVQLPVYSLFEAPTVRGLAASLAAAMNESGEISADELARMIAELDELTDEEAAALIAEGEAADERGQPDAP